MIESMLRALAIINAKYQDFRPFTHAEAWMLFRLAAIGEAVGWTLLICGIACSRLPVGWHDIPVQIAGRLHGGLFMIYAAAVGVLAPSLGWSWLKIIVGMAASVPPYGSLLFEQWAYHHQRRRDFEDLRGLLALKAIAP